MTQPNITRLALFTLLFYCNNLKSQFAQSYVDSIDRYQLFVDSLIHSFNSNPATALVHDIIHYSCPNDINTYGGGGSAEFYQDTARKITYQLFHNKGCDTIYTERTLYFIDNKIVLAIVFEAGGRKRTNYYRDDKCLHLGRWNSEREKVAHKDLMDGYEILKDFAQ